MSTKQQFGPWEVENSLQGNGRTCYLVRKSGGGLHVLKPAIPHKPIGQEVQVLTRLTDHPNIITLVDYDLQAPTPYHVTEYCSGGMIFAAKFNTWSLEELNHDTIHEKFRALFKAVGYIHSQGILLGGGLEIFLTDKKDFVIGDIETGGIWEHHHLDTTGDLGALSQLYHNAIQMIELARIHRQEQRNKEREVQRALEQAQPSAPRRLETDASLKKK